MNETDQIWVDGNRLEGEILHISPFSETLLYGRGLFETMGLHDGLLRFWAFHLDRLYAGGEDLGFDMPRRDQLTNHVQDVLRHADITSGRIRLLLFHNGVDQTPRILLHIARPPEPTTSSVRLHLSDVVRSVPSTEVRRKTTSYLDEWIVQRKAVAVGAFDGVMISGKGNIAEGSRSSIFVRFGGGVVTPPLTTGLLPGVGRRGVLSGAGEIGIEIHESEFTVEEFCQADGVVVVNALRGIYPVAGIESLEGKEIVDFGIASQQLAEFLRPAFERGWGRSSLRIEL
jgi:branched-chain amino acid aminotransferase